MISSSLGVFRASSLRLASVRSPVLALPIPRQRLLSTLVFPRYQRPQTDARWRNARWNSSAATPGAPAPVIPNPPPPPSAPIEDLIPDPEFVVDTIASLPPLQHGDLHALGFCHWTPAGLIQYSFELVHVFTGLPWFYTFIAATVFWRLVIFPFAVIGMRHTARLRPFTQEMNASSAEMAAARKSGDTVAIQRASMAATKIRADAGVSMLGLMAPMVQFPISLGMFFGIKQICELPVLQLTQSGFGWLPDLTQPSPYYILPILVAASGNMMIAMGARDMDPSRPGMGHLMNAFRVASILAIPWMGRFPSGLLLCLLVTSVTAVMQTTIFRVPAFRTALDIPPWAPMSTDGAKLPTMLDTFREYVYPRMSRSQQARQARQTPLGTDRVKAYTPPGLSAPLKTPPPPFTAPAPPKPAAAAPPSTLDLIAQQAQAQASVKSSSLFEASDKPTPKPSKQAAKASKPAAKASKPTKGGKKAKSKSA
ncbi:60Kd inner membrane protein-domain-containing protein [Mycena rosella]|uniref:60Kd inner membrane protein-domain-containing protein n=1 Tax=Mycena rosella TaxID=1033263 RepID=A0AAD7DUM2_MYCRO|nr:60Kd inner membrane protein-domain-containing protein [Mycena rosella]